MRVRATTTLDQTISSPRKADVVQTVWSSITYHTRTGPIAGGWSYPNTQTVTRSYDHADRLTGVTDWNSKTTTITPDANSNTHTIAFPGSTDTDTYTYDNANVMTAASIAPSVSSTTSLSYTPNNDGQVGSVSTTNLPGPGSVNYGYNASDEISTDSALSSSYTYDAAGNSTELGNGTNETYNSSGEMCDATPSTPSCSPAPTQSSADTYDTLGDRTSTITDAGTTSYNYNQLGQMTGASSAAPDYIPISPTRVCDTRTGQPSNQCTGDGFSGSGTLTVALSGTGLPVPTGASAVVVNLTAIDSSSSGSSFLTMYPAGTARPTTSNINVAAGTTVNNQVTVGLGTNSSGAEAVTIYNAANTVNVTVDVEGYYMTSSSGSTFEPITPARICDTRSGSGTQCSSNGAIGAGSTLTVQASNGSSVPSGATAIVADLTAINPTATTYLTTYANGTSRPSTSNLNAASGTVVNKEVTIPIDSNTKFVIYNASGSTNVTVDVEGYFKGGSYSNFVPVSPQRICDTRANDGLPSPYNQCNGSGGSAKTISSGGTLTIEGAGLPDVPSSATAIVAAVTTLNETASGFLTIYPAGASRPTTSEINFTSGATDNNEVTVGVGTSGDITIYNSSGTTDVLVDLLGYYTATPTVPSTSFTYNGDGLRTSSTVSSTTSPFTYDLASSVPAILTDGTWDYIYGPTGPGGQQLPIEQINVSSGATYYLHEDINGSVVVITDSTGHTVGSFSYDPFGNSNGASGTVTSPLGFTSGYLDSSTGLYYLINRYYDPTTAQFLSIDPVVASTGQPYQYAGDDPVNGSDPSGLCNSQGNGSAWDLFNPWSSNNPIRCSVENNPNSSTTQILERNPAYAAIQHGYDAYSLAQNPCSSNWDIAWQSTQALFWSGVTVASAVGIEQVGSGAVAYAVANPKTAGLFVCILIAIAAGKADTAKGNSNISQPFQRRYSAEPASRDADKSLCE